jgi:membrane protease YdiL (CAAX protease family)
LTTTAQTTRTNLIARYPVAAFTILATAFGGGTFYLVLQGDLPAALGLLAAPSASIAGIVVTAVADGRAGLKVMWKRLRIWRVGIGYWLFALLFLAPAFLLGSAANPLFGGDRLAISDIKPGLDIVPMFLAFAIVAGLGEELGFTGFLLPRLQARHSALTSAAIRAAVAGLWHLPLFLYSGPGHPALASFPYPGLGGPEGAGGGDGGVPADDPAAVVDLLYVAL